MSDKSSYDPLKSSGAPERERRAWKAPKVIVSVFGNDTEASKYLSPIEPTILNPQFALPGS